MNAAGLLVRCLENEGVRFVFGLPGEETLEITDALLDSRIRVIETRHEQGAAFMAGVNGRLSGQAGVCFSTLGRGGLSRHRVIGPAPHPRTGAPAEQAGRDRLSRR